MRLVPSYQHFFVLCALFSAVTPIGVAACSHTDTPTPDNSANNGGIATPHRDGGVVDPPDGGSINGNAATTVSQPSCSDYCDLVMAHCQGDATQYASENECLAFCARMPAGKAGDTHNHSRACRQFYAGSPALTDAMSYCLAAGPFGGGICGDRCTAFCQLASTVCFPDTGQSEQSEAVAPPHVLPYDSLPACATACASFDYEQANAEGGGEGPEGPTGGNTLNCRLYELRQIIVQSSAQGSTETSLGDAGCENIAPNSPTCQ
jgi:hypothetical protein